MGVGGGDGHATTEGVAGEIHGLVDADRIEERHHPLGVAGHGEALNRTRRGAAEAGEGGRQDAQPEVADERLQGSLVRVVGQAPAVQKDENGPFTGMAVEGWAAIDDGTAPREMSGFSVVTRRGHGPQNVTVPGKGLEQSVAKEDGPALELGHTDPDAMGLTDGGGVLTTGADDGAVGTC